MSCLIGRRYAPASARTVATLGRLSRAVRPGGVTAGALDIVEATVAKREVRTPAGVRTVLEVRVITTRPADRGPTRTIGVGGWYGLAKRG